MLRPVAAAVLEIDGLSVVFGEGREQRVAVQDVSLVIERGSMLALVGESGCGKSLTATALLGLAPAGARVNARSYRFEGEAIRLDDPESVAALRGRRIGMVFQDPLAALDPVETVGAQLVETLRVHSPRTRREAHARAVELLGEAGLPEPEARMAMHPHELSGGQRQRVTLALALAGEPALLVADEPTTALDPTLRLGLVAELDRLRRERGLAVLFVTHDLALVAGVAERIAVMYCGRVVEIGPRATLLRAPSHPYTVGLLASVPELGSERELLPTIPGVVPPLGAYPVGCAFAERCERAAPDCREAPPPLRAVGSAEVACLHPHADGAAGAADA